MSAVDLLEKAGAVSDANGVYAFIAPQTLDTSGADWDVISLVSSTELSFVVQIDSNYTGPVVEIVDNDSNIQLSLSIDKGSQRPHENSRKLILQIGNEAPNKFTYTLTSNPFQTLSLALSNGEKVSFFVDHHPSDVAPVTIPGRLSVGVAKGLILFSAAYPRNVARVSLSQTN